MKLKLPFLILSVAFAACSKPQVQESHQTVFRVPITAIPGLELKHGSSVNSNKVIDNIFEQIVSIDESLAPVPSLARSWKINVEKREVEFEIESSRKFHDGSSVTSQDVFNSLLKSRDNKSEVTSQILAFDQCAPNKVCPGFKILDLTHFIIKLKDRNFPLLMKSFANASASIMKKIDGRYIGTGPYKIDQISGEAITVSRFDDRAHFSAIIYRKIDSKNTLRMFLDGEIDTLTDFDFQASMGKPSSDYPSLKKMAGTYSLVFQVEKGIFKKRENRLAIAKAVDVLEFQKRSKREGIPAGGIIPKGYPGYTEKGESLNIKQAKVLIAHNTEADNRKVILGLGDCLKGSEDLEKYLINTFEEIGLSLEIKYLPFNELLEEVRLRKLDIILKGEAPVNFDPSTLFIGYVNGNSERLQGYKNTAIKSLFSEYQSKTDKTSQAKILKKIQKIFLEDIPLIPVFYPIVTTWFSPRLQVKNAGALSLKFWNFSYQDIYPNTLLQN